MTLRLYTLVEAAGLLGPSVSVKVLRAEVHAGRLKALRLRPGPNAKIFLRLSDIETWLDATASRRQLVPCKSVATRNPGTSEPSPKRFKTPQQRGGPP